MSDFVLHPDAVKDLEEIWEYIAGDNLEAADQLLGLGHRRYSIRSPKGKGHAHL